MSSNIVLALIAYVCKRISGFNEATDSFFFFYQWGHELLQKKKSTAAGLKKKHPYFAHFFSPSYTARPVPCLVQYSHHTGTATSKKISPYVRAYRPVFTVMIFSFCDRYLTRIRKQPHHFRAIMKQHFFFYNGTANLHLSHVCLLLLRFLKVFWTWPMNSV